MQLCPWAEHKPTQPGQGQPGEAGRPKSALPGERRWLSSLTSFLCLFSRSQSMAVGPSDGQAGTCSNRDLSPHLAGHQAIESQGVVVAAHTYELLLCVRPWSGCFLCVDRIIPWGEGEGCIFIIAIIIVIIPILHTTLGKQRPRDLPRTHGHRKQRQNRIQGSTPSCDCGA